MNLPLGKLADNSTSCNIKYNAAVNAIMVIRDNVKSILGEIKVPKFRHDISPYRKSSMAGGDF